MGVILRSKATKNLMDSGTYIFEILQLTPQNDVVGQPLRGDFQAGKTIW